MQGFRVQPQQLEQLQFVTPRIRNICIIAHIDHGKTTLADSLISSNGIISPKMAGKLRFLDSTEDEQKRGITMHSSAISLLYAMEPLKAVNDGEIDHGILPKSEDYLINLIDSPGHIDFSSDVSTATRLCDGAMIVVDCLEGVCSQTHALLYKAMRERLHPILILNKIDRLITELKLTPEEAFQHLRRLVERVNAVASTLLYSELRFMEAREMGEAEVTGASTTPVESATAAGEEEEEHPLVLTWTFEPHRGNVVFSSAVDCWGFGVGKFALYWASKLQVNRGALQKHMFDDYAFNPATKKIVRVDPYGSSNVKPMFVTMILEPLWQMYDVTLVQQNGKKAANMAKRALGVEIFPRDIAAPGADCRNTLRAIMRLWMPLADAILRSVVRSVPDPAVAQANKLSSLFPVSQQQMWGQSTGLHIGVPAEPQSQLPPAMMTKIHDRVSNIKRRVSLCDISSPAETSGECPTLSAEDDCNDVIVFISKMIPVRVAELSPADAAWISASMEESGDSPDDLYAGDKEVFLALGRVFAGTLRSHDRRALHVLGHHYNPYLPNEPGEFAMTKIQTVAVPESLGLYMCLGPSVCPVSAVPAGNVVAIFGLHSYILKSATLCSSPHCFPMAAITFQAKPMLRVAVEPVHHNDLRKLEEGMRKLYQYDPVVELGTGEHGQSTLTCLGELHLELCLKALRERFAKCDITVSEPLVPFRETVITAHSGSANHSGETALPPPWKDTDGLRRAKAGLFRFVTSSRSLAVTIRCFALPVDTASALDNDTSSEGKTLAAALERCDVANVWSGAWQSFDDIPSSSEISVEVLRTMWGKVMSTIVSAADDVYVDPCLYDPHHSVRSDEKDPNFELLGRIISLGPHGAGPNMLIMSPSITLKITSESVSAPPAEINVPKDCSEPAKEIGGDIPLEGAADTRTLLSVSLTHHWDVFLRVWSRVKGALLAGFQMVTASGPLMAESLHGVGFAVESVEISRYLSGISVDELRAMGVDLTGVYPDVATEHENAVSALSMGQLISDVKDAMKVSMLSAKLRIVEPLYKCSIQCDQMQLGNLYPVLSRRRGEVIEEDVIEGTTLFILTVVLPVADSFGFSQELLKKTSGSGTAPQLFFSHWRRIDLDPFWKPTTAEELEDLGKSIVEPNLPRVFIDTVRKRKGLVVEEKIVVSAEKQRNLKTNK